LSGVVTQNTRSAEGFGEKENGLFLSERSQQVHENKSDENDRDGKRTQKKRRSSAENKALRASSAKPKKWLIFFDERSLEVDENTKVSVLKAMMLLKTSMLVNFSPSKFDRLRALPGCAYPAA
jgi:hypothetical protein